MAEKTTKTGVEIDDHACDVRVWSPSCQRNVYSNDSEKYLCASCGTIPDLKHEMHHEHFPHLSGDTDDMS
ncbi:hypothetical protein E4633_15380 [Geomonas terrae]|uniref:Uncharacterized protein n=1 Tax=Geomonas terrae TaxID=2562681 RepID=A0A4S1CDW8_9BACT|nr:MULTISPECIES: hypothetical protein [Geomonas]TGU71685.1 hypothetical protein E4633_15380 [Geomonas terrae]